MDFKSFLITDLQLTLIIALRYFLIAGLFYWLLWGRPESKVRARRLTVRRPRAATVRHEIKMSLFSSAIYAVPGAIVIEAFKQGGTAVYTGPITGFAGWVYVPISLLAYLAIHDAYFYWTHRLMHHPLLFRVMHLTHHRSRSPTPWAAFSFHPWEAVISAWVLPLAAFFIPIHAGAALFLLVFITYCSVANHAGWEILPQRWIHGALGQHFISASHHNVHHTDYDANFGLYFRFWDQLMGTDRDLAKPVTEKAEPHSSVSAT
jgi:sterol desaturase/sphingolipid hydroxylase (fatty acid hydroxylase superfamily)